ncbi:MAG: hypothetical protein EOP22_16555 [Hyphomicrobiales bacterium]|nr:MAG: hypothetical protein EOP22_16555 [Hyphomicrobiales bacterium]
MSNEEMFPSLTPSAVQVRWRVPTEFPACPDMVSESALEEYAARLVFGAVFAQNSIYKSVTVQCDLSDGELVVRTHLPGDTIKHWAVANVSMKGGLFVHRSESTFYELQGALMHYCEIAKKSYDDPFDNYC